MAQNNLMAFIRDTVGLTYVSQVIYQQVICNILNKGNNILAQRSRPVSLAEQEKCRLENIQLVFVFIKTSFQLSSEQLAVGEIARVWTGYSVGIQDRSPWKTATSYCPLKLNSAVEVLLLFLFSCREPQLRFPLFLIFVLTCCWSQSPETESVLKVFV